MYDSIIILGPTATGKTKISIELAKTMNTEIVNADSMYIYRDLSIGTAKPTEDEKEGIVHHVIDVADPKESFNVVNYRNLAENVIINMKNRGKVPIIVGGTGFYIDSLIKNYSYGCTFDSQLRANLEQELQDKGKIYMHNKLASINPELAQKLNVNDTVRIIRALEICLQSEDQSNLYSNNLEPILKHPLIIGLNIDREQLYSRINQRVDIMLQNGLLDEVKTLVDKGYNPLSHQSMRGIGYKEIYDYLIGNCTLEDAIEKIKQHTRNYAKRQITWFKRNNQIIWLNPLTSSIHDNINTILNLFNN